MKIVFSAVWLGVWLLSLSLQAFAAGDQTGAEAVKKPVGVAIVNVRKIPGWEGGPVGNVEVTYADGSRDRWTTMGAALFPKVAADGVVGWVDCSTTKDGKKTVDLSKGVPVGSRLVLCDKGKVTARVSAGKPFIEEWGFTAEGGHFVVKSRAAHGPAIIERFTRPEGKPAGSFAAFADDLPDWAKNYRDQ